MPAVLSQTKKIIFSFFTFVLSLIFIELTLQSISYFVVKSQKDRLLLNNQNQIWVFGESTSSWYGENSYPALLQKKLDAYSNGRKFEVVNFAWGGSDSKTQLALFKKNLGSARPKMIITMLGINDWYVLVDRATNKYHDELWKFRFYRLSYIFYVNYLERFFSTKSILIAAYSDNLPDENYSQELTAPLKHSISKADFRNAREFTDSKVPVDQRRNYYYLAASLINDAFDFSQNPESLVAEMDFLDQCLKIDPQFLPCINLLISDKSYAKDNFESISPLINLALKSDTRNGRTLRVIAREYTKQGRTPEAIDILENFLLKHPVDDHITWRALIDLLKKVNDQKRLKYWLTLYNKEFSPNGNGMRARPKMEHFHQQKAFINNFKEFFELSEQNNIKMVSVQYPMLSNQPLKELISSPEKVIWVENRANFQSVLKQKNYDDIFTDRFSLSFGHFNRFGAELIANEIFENIKSEL